MTPTPKDLETKAIVDPLIGDFVRNRDENQMRYTVLADMQKMRFDALIKAGFSEQQALFLTKA